MDEVLEILGGTVISQDANNENRTNFDGLYKNWGKLGNQEERRKEILEIQKSNRNNKLDKFRGILELVSAVEQNEIFQSQKAYYRPNIYVAGFNKASLTYNNILMMSEWMIEKPADFSENWYMVPCPKGVRMLVVASQGITKCYSKFGQFRYQNRTALPGGNPTDPKRKNRCCVLDCFFQENINTMFILDLLAWNNQPMTDGETEFRHYWLESQLAELPGLKVISRSNEIIFKLLPKVPCTPESLNKFMMQCPMFEQNCPPLDGLLFYHKHAHYVSGETPLVGWLFPFMLPEVLGPEFTVNDMYVKERPEDYVSQADYIDKFEAKVAKKNVKKNGTRLTSTNDMDTADGDRNEEETRQSMEAEENQDITTSKTKKRVVKNKSNESKSSEVMEDEEIEERTNVKNKKKVVPATVVNTAVEIMEADVSTDQRPDQQPGVTKN